MQAHTRHTRHWPAGVTTIFKASNTRICHKLEGSLTWGHCDGAYFVYKLLAVCAVAGSILQAHNLFPEIYVHCLRLTWCVMSRLSFRLSDLGSVDGEERGLSGTTSQQCKNGIPPVARSSCDILKQTHVSITQNIINMTHDLSKHINVWAYIHHQLRHICR